MSRIKVLFEILSKPKFLLAFIAASLLVFLLFGNLSGLLQNPFFVSKRMIPATSSDYAFLVLVSVLSGLLFAIVFHKIEELKQGLGKEGLGAGGSIIGYLTIACPSCNLLLFSLFGIQANLLALYPFKPELRVLSILLLLFSLFLVLRDCKTCVRGLKNGKS